MSKPPLRRCAVYTRKSSEEGLEQDFNSLHAQREACEAYIKSQQGEGWKALATEYDDGGISGGTMERPSLQRLLSDIALGKIDVVVVYKVDRLTRALSDFAKIVEVFDSKGVSFVSVTQQFNTTTSMGRLTLNVLLSFAQFEREVTGERIRDKIAASKKKGMWMGGGIPLGYASHERTLIPIPEEVTLVNEIFRSYLRLKSVTKLIVELDERGVRSKSRVTKAGRLIGGNRIGKGALYCLLSNPIYLGQIRHKKVVHPGMHPPIVDKELWDQTQAMLKVHAVTERHLRRKSEPSLLMGKIFDDAGQRFIPSQTNKRGRRYRYYISKPEQPQARGRPSASSTQWRLPAMELELAVTEMVKQCLQDNPGIMAAGITAGLTNEQMRPLLDRAAEDLRDVQTDNAKNVLYRLLDRVVLSDAGIEMKLKLQLEGAEPFYMTRTKPMMIRRRGIEMRLVIEGQRQPERPADETLLRAIAKGKRWIEMLASGKAASVTEIAKRENVTERWVSRLIPMAFLSPTLVASVLEGTQPEYLTAQWLMYGKKISPTWNDLSSRAIK